MSQLLSWRRQVPEGVGAAGLAVVRRYAIKKCAEWMLERFEGSDGLGAIYPAMQYAIMALDVLGYGAGTPLRRKAAWTSSSA